MPTLRVVAAHADIWTPATTCETIARSVDTGFGHIVLGLSAPYPPDVAHWVATELIDPCT